MEVVVAMFLVLVLIMAVSLFLEFKKCKEYKREILAQSIEVDFANKKIKHLREELYKADSENSELIKKSWRFTKNDKVVFKDEANAKGYDTFEKSSEVGVLTVVQYTCEDIVLLYDGNILHQVRESHLELFTPNESLETIDVEYEFENIFGEKISYDSLAGFVGKLYEKGALHIGGGIGLSGNEQLIYKISAIKRDDE